MNSPWRVASGAEVWNMNKLVLILGCLLVAGCQEKEKDDKAIVAVQATTISTHLERLSSDKFLGRMPFTEGETLTVAYLKEEFEKLGLLPGNGDSYFQEVPLVEITGTPSEKMEISGPDGDFDLNFYEDFVVNTRKTDVVTQLKDSPLVFAGYGIVAPEYDWNDYEGIDWKGKTALVLVNDPGFTTKDTTLFKGSEMTYYGRWTYKFEEAARQGASGVLIIHETEPASYGWNVVQASNTGSQLGIEGNDELVDIQGWISSEAAVRLFEAAGIENKDFRAMALDPAFQPAPLDLSASVQITNEIKRDVSRNVVARIDGGQTTEEYIVYAAHWDHLGIGKAVDGDSIYNGAVDNASGTACLLAIAEAFKNGRQPERSIVFLAVTAEEQGLLGSAYYAAHPIYPPEKTVAAINMDAFESPGPMKDFTITGFGHSEMDDYADEIARKHGRYIMPDPEPEKGYFFRSDHFNFAKIGIPALFASGAYEDFERGPGYIKQKRDDYQQNHYHQPSDEFDPKQMSVSGVQADAQLLYEIGLKLSTEAYFPKWYKGSEFRAAREGDE